MTKQKRNYDEDSTEKKIRQDTIIEIIQEEEIKTQEELINELIQKGIKKPSQVTISRDLYELNINKRGTKYQLENVKQFHQKRLEELIQRRKPLYYPHISYRYLQTGKGEASVYAYHLLQAFPDAILDVTIGGDSLIILINMDASDTESLLSLFE